MNIQPKLIELLNKRGITDQKEIDEFLSDKPQKTYDPFLLHNMEAGVDLILSAIDDDKKICIYGDYDADGITSTSILMEVLSNLTKHISYYIPSRFDEGYGLNCEALNKIKAAGVGLVITVDCGSVSCKEVEYAKEIGLQILVTDHHNITDKIADCLVINPMQPECSYPFSYLAGCGVAFKLAQAIVAVTGLPKSVLTRTLDLVGIGTIGDIVPLVDENRTLAKYGIRAVNLSQREGLRKLIEKTGLRTGYVSSENISFVIVPHLNASGRMVDAKIAAGLMMEKSAEGADAGVDKLVECNNMRKSLQSETFDLCCRLIETEYKDDYFFVIHLEDAHEGITGIVAGKIKETYGRPTVIVTPTGEDCLKGTGRSIEGVNLYSMLKENEELFERFGGHAAACGFTIKKDNLLKLRENLNNSMKKAVELNPGIFDHTLEPDMVLEAEDVSLELAEQIAMLEPFGCSNPKPLISVKAVPSDIKKIGSKGQYTRFFANLDDGRQLQCVIFKRADEYDDILQRQKKVSIIGTLESKFWNGRRYLQLMVQEIGE